jgi:hypothetical protein
MMFSCSISLRKIISLYISSHSYPVGEPRQVVSKRRKCEHVRAGLGMLSEEAGMCAYGVCAHECACVCTAFVHVQRVQVYTRHITGWSIMQLFRVTAST